MKTTFTRSNILEAIKFIDKNPDCRKGRNSSTYDLVHEGEYYPPILVLSIANQLLHNQDLYLKDFNNKVDEPFKILRDLGFIIEKKK